MDISHKKLLEKILNSNEFAHSKIYQTFLTYLVESAAAGKDLKEITIAIEVFGKDSSFNPAEDTIVRSHTYNLRKKLESYYFHEGREDKYRLKIPKGHYETKFIPVSENQYPAKKLLFKLTKNYYVFAILALSVLLVLLWFHLKTIDAQLKRYRTIDKNDPFWKEYLQSDLPILIAVGDHFFFNEYLDKYKQHVVVRHPKINSIEDFHALYPNLTVQPSSEPYFPYHSIWSLCPIFSMLFSVNKTPILRKSSDISPQILDEYNIIFLGSIKTLYKLKHTLLKSHFRYHISPHRIIYTPPDSGEVQIFKTNLHSPGPNEDLVIAVKLPGPAKNSIFIIASYHSLGAPEITNYLISPTKRIKLEQMFEEKYGKIPQYFEILFRVTGIDKTAYSTNILVCNKLTPN